MERLTAYSVRQLRRGLRDRKFSAVEVVEAYAGEINRREKEVGAFLHLDVDGARRTAASIDRARASWRDLPPLAGTVVAVKDNIAVHGLPLTAGSRILEGYLPPQDATVIARLRRAGAIIIGKTNLDEFAMGASTEQSGFHTTKNPRDPSRVPGGSSGGSAAAVAGSMATVALGSDTGGSVRQPAAFCGLVGLRPTYGGVSRSGLVAMASSMDVIGPLGRSVDDVRALLHAIHGFDPDDATTVPHFSIEAEAEPAGLRGLRVGLPREYLAGELSDEVRRAFDRTRTVLASAGAELVEVSMPMTDQAIPTYYVLTPSEASSNLARYDGLRFGWPAEQRHGHQAASARLRGQRFGPEPQRRILTGTFTLSAGYADRYYHTAQRVRTLIRQDFVNAFQQADVLLTPTTPAPAFPLGSVADPIAMYRQDIFVSAVSLAGVPALSLPVEGGTGLPVGVQLIGPQGQDDRLLSIAAAVETALRPSSGLRNGR